MGMRTIRTVEHVHKCDAVGCSNEWRGANEMESDFYNVTLESGFLYGGERTLCPVHCAEVRAFWKRLFQTDEVSSGKEES